MNPADTALEFLEIKLKRIQSKIDGHHKGLFLVRPHEMLILLESADRLREEISHLKIQASSWVDGVGSGMEYTA